MADTDPEDPVMGRVRAWLEEAGTSLHDLGHWRATAARKLAAARSFLRYLRREGFIDDDPGALVGTPRRDVRMRLRKRVSSWKKPTSGAPGGVMSPETEVEMKVLPSISVRLLDLRGSFDW